MGASPFFTSGRTSILPSITSQEELHTANSLTQTTQWTTLTIGTMVAGLSAADPGLPVGVCSEFSLLFWVGRMHLAIAPRRGIQGEARRPDGRTGRAAVARIQGGPALHALVAAAAGNCPDRRGLGHRRWRGANSLHALWRAGVQPRPGGHWHAFGVPPEWACWWAERWPILVGQRISFAITSAPLPSVTSFTAGPTSSSARCGVSPAALFFIALSRAASRSVPC